jgi:hypothetical protein
MSTRNWYSWNKPVTVYYKMVGGGAGASLYGGTAWPQYASAGGSSAILKNGTLISVANGMNGGGSTRAVSQGSFTVSSTDTLLFIAGGGAGSGFVAYQYTGIYNFYVSAGGGGSGYYGGGAGDKYLPDWTGNWPPNGAAVASGGTGTAGGAGMPAGGYGYGGTNGTSGYDGGGGSGASMGGTPGSPGFWNGYGMVYTLTGGGGGYGKSGNPGGSGPDSRYCSYQQPPGRPSTMPLGTTFDLDPTAGTAATAYSFDPGYGYQNCISGGAFGQIVLQYQAPTCDLIPQWNMP